MSSMKRIESPTLIPTLYLAIKTNYLIIGVQKTKIPLCDSIRQTYRNNNYYFQILLSVICSGT